MATGSSSAGRRAASLATATAGDPRRRHIFNVSTRLGNHVHIYGQECFQYLNRNREAVPLASVAAVDRETAKTTTAARMKMMGAVRKMPLSRSLDDFTDTAHMCSPHQPTPDRGAPSPSPSAGRAAGPGLRQDLGARSGVVSPQFEFEMPSCSTATVSETRAVFDRRPGEL
ncbi:hypothetical protein FJT64_011391 [Amphibalanus amphitrite]|uniref:Uncharacterized protein n=1 Tax=Amphibalanus amphitrite TaxID=1232801 RepID=A0A6A4V9F2_AMPAM|nr:hypothetical protein FJT64_011391 [Amphibalanus amphitrite]